MRQLSKDDLQRPAVDHRVVAVEYQHPVTLVAPHQRGAKQRPVDQVEYVIEFIAHQALVFKLPRAVAEASQIGERQLERNPLAHQKRVAVARKPAAKRFVSMLQLDQRRVQRVAIEASLEED